MKKYVLIFILLISSLLLTFNLSKEEKSKEVIKVSKIDKILEKPAGIQAYTYLGEETTHTYDYLIKNKLVDSITCKNGTSASYNYEDNTVILTNIKIPDYCVMDFKEGYSVSLTAVNGTVTAPTSQTIGYNGSVSFTVSPSDGYKAELSTNTCGGTLSGTTYTVSNVTSNKSCSITFKSDVNEFTWSSGTLGYKMLQDNPTRSTRTSFSAVFTDTTTGTLYTSTEENVHNEKTTVYYYAGNTTNNWVKFGEYATDLVYGYRYSVGGFGAGGYKEYSSLDECNSASSYNKNCKYINKKGDSFYWRIIRTNADGSVRLLYSGSDSEGGTAGTTAYIGESAFNSNKDDPMYVGYMYGTSGSLESNRLNTNDSTIKGVIDTWYASNLSSYTSYLSTTAVYCNDRGLALESPYSPRYSTSSTFYYAPEDRLSSPSYDCTTEGDAFSGSNEKAKLTYPIALMTADEITYAGGKSFSDNASVWYDLNSSGSIITGGSWWWLLSPHWYVYTSNSSYTSQSSYGWLIYESIGPAWLSSDYVYNIGVVRPVISIKSTVKASGSGTASDPYTLSAN